MARLHSVDGTETGVVTVRLPVLALQRAEFFKGRKTRTEYLRDIILSALEEEQKEHMDRNHGA